jgi:hypothetical protein
MVPAGDQIPAANKADDGEGSQGYFGSGRKFGGFPGFWSGFGIGHMDNLFGFRYCPQCNNPT